MGFYGSMKGAKMDLPYCGRCARSITHDVAGPDGLMHNRACPVVAVGAGSPYVDVQSIGTTIDSGDAYLAAFKYENAVAAYQIAAGQGQTLKQEIPANLWPPSADGLNAQLEGLQEHLASQATARQAQSLAKQLFGLYQAAVASMPASGGSTVITPTTPATPTAPSQTNAVAVAALWGVVALGVGYLGYLMFRGPRENPTGQAEKAKPAKRHLIAKGRAVRFDMKDGGSVSARGGMLHDPSGRFWPRHSILVGPFRPRMRKATDEEYRGPAKDYLGRTHVAYVGTVNTPPKALGGWDYLGEVETIWYTRTGKKAPGRFFHPFNKVGLARLVRGKKRVRLYRRGRFYRLELGHGALLDGRGIVTP